VYFLTNLYLGYTDAELVSSPYARFYKPQMAGLPPHVKDALLNGAVAEELMPGFEFAAELQNPGYWQVETGHTLAADRSARVSILTYMPGVTPAMWDWWFAWHGSEAQRYKLWHPRSHVYVAWEDGREGLDTYIGRTSQVVEYIGSTRMDLTIRFVPPASVGFDEQLLSEKGEVAICARGGVGGLPFETGWLIHHVRPVPGGSEMRSRFWLAGDNIELRGHSGAAGKLLSRTAAFLNRDGPRVARDILVHCAQEMNHLAALLPELYANFYKEPTDESDRR